MLLTKIHIPAPGSNTVHRSDLFDKLNEGLKRKLILVSASAGFGKSTLISDWISQFNIPAAWFSIDNNDNDPVDFLCYIITAIQSIKKDFGQGAFDLLKSPNPPSPDSVVNMLINEIVGIDKDFLLILDDFHLIKNKEVISLTAYFLEHIPVNAHLVILTRSDPALPIARIRSQHQLVELRSSDLSFSATDISTLFNKRLRIKLTTEDINLLKTKTEGWIAGLQLTALSMTGREDISEFIESFTGDNRYIMDYLIEEVLRNQPDDIKEFLLLTSILEQVSAPICNVLLSRNDSQLILEKLELENTFLIPLDSQRHWYRYHHLFADLLKQRLLVENKSIVNELHTKACEWYEENDLYELAIKHALEIKDYEKCIQLLGEIAENMWETGLHAGISTYGDLLPNEIIEKNPEFSLYYSWILISGGRIKLATPFLKSAEALTKTRIAEKNSSLEIIQKNKVLLGKIAVAFAYLNSHEEYSESTLEYCKTAMENLSEDDPLWYSWAWFSYGVAYFSNGSLTESQEAFNNAFDYAQKSGNIYQISTIAIRMAENEQQLGNYTSAYKKCSSLLELLKEKGYLQITKADWTYAGLYFTMGTAEYMWADTDKAFENIKIAYELSKNGTDIYLKVFVLMVYSVVLLELGNSKSKEKFDEVDKIMEQLEVPPFVNSMFIGWKSYILSRDNKIDQALKLFADNDIKLNGEISYTNEMAYVSYARILLLQNKLNEAEQLITKLHADACLGNRFERTVELKLLFCELYRKLDKRKLAIQYLMEAMQLASKEELLSYFVFNPDDIFDIYEDVFKIHATTSSESIGVEIPKSFIEKLKLALKKKTPQKKTGENSDLSSRELDTLKLIGEELTNQEIADKLFVSLNTVKTHLKNINLKLEVNSRQKAVNKAKELGLL